MQTVGIILRLVGESKVNAKWRVDVTLQLLLGRKIIRVGAKLLHVLVVELDNFEVGLDTGGGDGFGDNSAATGD